MAEGDTLAGCDGMESWKLELRGAKHLEFGGAHWSSVALINWSSIELKGARGLNEYPPVAHAARTQGILLLVHIRVFHFDIIVLKKICSAVLYPKIFKEK